MANHNFFKSILPTFAEHMALCYKDPDKNDLFFRLKKGEWALNTEFAFEAQLKKLRNCPKIKPLTTLEGVGVYK